MRLSINFLKGFLDYVVFSVLVDIPSISMLITITFLIPKQLLLKFFSDFLLTGSLRLKQFQIVIVVQDFLLNVFF